MRLGLTCKILSIAFLAMSCKAREYNGSETQTANSVGQIVPFNAYLLWRDGNKNPDGTTVKPILEYRTDYDRNKEKVTPDGVFYVAADTYWKDRKFIGTTTGGAKVEGDVLTYPEKEGRNLSLKFSQVADNGYHETAKEKCKKLGLRLPHIQEIIDFCAAGTVKDLEGKYGNHRCGKNGYYWSVSKDSKFPGMAWRFSTSGGVNGGDVRFEHEDHFALCVSAP
jgi:hypothetical protein